MIKALIMGKLFKIITWIVVLSVVYIWFSTVFKSCNNPVENGLSTATDAIENVAEDAADAVTDVGEELFEDEDEIAEDEDYADETESVEIEEEIIEEEIIDDPVEEEPNYNNRSSSSGGQYMLIAGNYLVESNGREMIKKLKNFGYSSADIAIFDQSQYHTVIASRYDSYNEALRAESNLKAKGIDCYVKKKS